MRDLEKVIDEILNVIPADQKDLRSALENHKSSVMFSAPENIGMWWVEVADSLMDHIGDDEPNFTEWQKKVSKIWNNQN